MPLKIRGKGQIMGAHSNIRPRIPSLKPINHLANQEAIDSNPEQSTTTEMNQKRLYKVKKVYTLVKLINCAGSQK